MGGWAAHHRAVDRLTSSYHRDPARTHRPAGQADHEPLPPAGRADRPRARRLRPDGVIEVDRGARTAEVQGMCTYEDLVDATLPHGLVPLVVPQLRTITLGGAVTGLGIEATSFRNGLPHESVLEMDVFTGAGEVVTTRPGRRPLRRLPQLLRLPRLRHPAADRPGAGAVAGRAAAPALRRRGAAGQDDRGGHRDPRARRPAGRRAGRRRLRAGGVLPDARPLGPRRRDHERSPVRLHRPGDLLPVRCASARPTC